MKTPAVSTDAPAIYVREMARPSPRRGVGCCVRAKACTVAVRLLPDVKEAKAKLSRALELSATRPQPDGLYSNPGVQHDPQRVYSADAPGRAGC